MQASARVVVIGGGVAGCSLIYHLTKLGCTDVVLLEKNELTSGSTWHAAGLLPQFNPSYNLMLLLRYSVDCYRELQEATGHPVDFHGCGSIRLATTPDRVDEFYRASAVAEMVGVPFELISPEKISDLFPLVDPTGVTAGAFLPTDGWVDPASVANAFANAAKTRGVDIRRHSPVTAITRSRGRWLLETPTGTVSAEIVVNAAGQWGREVGRMVGVDLPIVPLQHQYILTDDLDEVRALKRELPVLRDPDGSFYVRQDGDGLLIGPFEQSPRTWGLDGIPRHFHSRLLPPDVKRISSTLDAVTDRVPCFEHAGLKRVINGPDGYTPDGRPLMGPIPGLRNFHVLAGFSIFGIVFGGGAGKYAAEWILDDQPSDNMWELDVRRFGEFARSKRYVVDRACEAYEREYAIRYPEEEWPAGRPLKTSPIYDRLLAKGAVYGARFGWERPLWFARGTETRDAYSFRRGNWHEAVGDECRAVRSCVGVLDQTSFAKFEVFGPEAERFLDRLCANALPGVAGRMALTQMCTDRGGIECDVTVTRLSEDRFYLISAAATELHDFEWMARHLPDDDSVRIENVSGQLGVLTLAGPRSRELLEALTDAECSREAFPFFSSREIDIGTTPVLALRVSYVGELGYELHHPVEYQRSIYDQIMAAGRDFPIVDFGYRALESMRLEKAYRLWGVDMSADFSPLEAGMDRFVQLDNRDFIGREALLREQERGVSQELACLLIEDGDADPHGYEPIFDGNQTIGYVASGGYGHTVERTIALAYLPTNFAKSGTQLSVSIMNEQRRAEVVSQPVYDPDNTRLLS